MFVDMVFILDVFSCYVSVVVDVCLSEVYVHVFQQIIMKKKRTKIVVCVVLYIKMPNFDFGSTVVGKKPSCDVRHAIRMSHQHTGVLGFTRN